MNSPIESSPTSPAPPSSPSQPSSSRACTIWFTGLSGAGKTTVSSLVAAALRQRGLPIEVLDGDVVRQWISSGLGFSRADRDENIRRISWVADLLTRNNVFVCAAAISPYDAARKQARAMVGDFVLVYCKAPIEVLEQRDTKQLYARARAGLIKGLSGVDDPYEPPTDHEVEVCSDGSETPQQSAHKVLRCLQQLGYLPPD